MTIPNSIPLFEDINRFNETIQVGQSLYTEVDVRKFEHNMDTARLVMPAFRMGFYQIALKLSGSGAIRLGQGVIRHGDHDQLYFSVPGKIQSWDVENDWHGFYILFKPDYFSLAPANEALLRDFPFLHISFHDSLPLAPAEAVVVRDLFEKLYAEYTSPSTGKQGILASYIRLILQYAKRFYANRPPQLVVPPPALSSRFDAALERDWQSLGRPQSVVAYAAEMHLAPGSLSEGLKRETGWTAGDLIQQRRLLEAKMLLFHTLQSVSEIAYALDFTDPAYFHRFFKRLTGTTPLHFREQARA